MTLVNDLCRTAKRFFFIAAQINEPKYRGQVSFALASSPIRMEILHMKNFKKDCTPILRVALTSKDKKKFTIMFKERVV
jgi:hypothetical protein